MSQPPPHASPSRVPTPTHAGGGPASRWFVAATRIVPGLMWIRAYRRDWLASDAIAGITVAAVIVPIGMAFGQLSGLPAIAGVYASLLPLVIYALFGSSRQLILGPDTSTSALLAAAVAPLAGGDGARYAALAGLLALLVGGLCVAAGVARLDFLADFLSKPILVGYINGLALTVIASQLGKLLGIPIQASGFFGQLAELVPKVGRIHWPTAALGGGVLVMVLLTRRVAPRLPGALIAVTLATLAVGALHLEAYGVSTVGPIPAGLPSLRIPPVSACDVAALASSAIGITVLTFCDTILNARTFARRNGYRIDDRRELVALGVSNVAAGLSQGYPVSASGTRTAVNEVAGGKTPVASLVAAAALALLLLFGTAPLSQFPSAALGAVLIAAVLGLLDVGTLRQLWRIRERDWAIAMVTMIGVLVFGLLPGILIAVALSLLVLLLRAVRPHDAVLGRVVGLDGFHDIGDYPESQTLPGLIVYRFDAPLFFANAQHFSSRVQELVASSPDPVGWFMVDAEAITDIDSTAADMLVELQADLKRRGIILALARAKQPLREQLRRNGLLDRIGAAYLFPSIRSGVAAFVDLRDHTARSADDD